MWSFSTESIHMYARFKQIHVPVALLVHSVACSVYDFSWGRVCCLKVFEAAGEPKIHATVMWQFPYILSIHLNPFALNAPLDARNSHAFESFPHFHPWIAPLFGAITILVGLIPCILRICPCSARLHLSLANHHEIPNSGHFHVKNGLWLETNAQEVQQNRKTISKPDIMSGSYGPYGNWYVTWKGRGWWSKLMRCEIKRYQTVACSLEHVRVAFQPLSWH